MTFPLNLYSLNSILPHLSLICQNKFFDQGLHIFWFFFLFFYPLKLVIGFANVTSFKLKIMTLFSTSTIPLNLFMKIILSHMTHLLSFLLFIHFFHTEYPLLVETPLLRSYVFYYYYYYYYYLFFYLRGFTESVRWRACASQTQFAEESELRRSVPWLVCASAQ
jgi:hypothetical protein